jgi:hypothetical protein
LHFALAVFLAGYLYKLSCAGLPVKQIYNSKNNHVMGNLLYLIAVILIIFWAIGYFGYQAGGLIHILLVIAVIAVLLKIIRGSSN